MRKLFRRIYFLLHRGRLERELAEEMAAHRDMMPVDRRRNFGNALLLREDARAVWWSSSLDHVWQDLRHAARVLANSPGFTLGAVAVLALGVGVNLAEFQIFDGLMFHRLDVRDADSLLHLSRNSRRGRTLGFPYGAFEFYEAQSRSFAWLVAEDSTPDVTVEGEASARATLVSPDYFSNLGVAPAWGRLINSQDAQPGAEPVVALGYDYWRNHFGADPDLIGRLIHVNNKPVQVVGVLPYTFARGLLGRRSEVWFPVSMRALLMAGSPPVHQDFARPSHALFGKLKPGAPLAAGQEELTSLTHELARRYPLFFRDDEHLQGELVQQSVAQTVRRQPAIAIFFVVILLVLLSACANLGNMLLARGMVRQREIDIRMAIGASRGRVLCQLMTENLLLALLGSAAGLAFGAVANRLLLNALGAPFTIRLSTGWPVVVAGLVLTIVSAIAFGLPAALQIVRVTRRKVRLRQSLIGVQVAVSCLLLIASGVLVHNAILSASVDLAFDYRNMLVVYPQLYGRNLGGDVARQKLDALSTSLGSLPGVKGITVAIVPPLGGRAIIETVPGLPHVYRNAVAPSYFDTMQLPVLRGRTFMPAEQGAAVLSESAARAMWPGQDPLGKVSRLGGADRTVVGVVKDSGANRLADDSSIETYLPIDPAEVSHGALILRTQGDPAPLVRMISGTAAAINETVAITLMRASRESVLESQRRMVTLIGSIGTVATALAAAGMFALVAFTVAQRRRELGIRMAIGAGPRHILDVLLRQNAKATAVGAIVGVLLAAALSRLVRSQIPFQSHESMDVVGFAAGLACFALVAFLAMLSPALRALRIDPSTTLRDE